MIKKLNNMSDKVSEELYWGKHWQQDLHEKNLARKEELKREKEKQRLLKLAAQLEEHQNHDCEKEDAEVESQKSEEKSDAGKAQAV